MSSSDRPPMPAGDPPTPDVPAPTSRRRGRRVIALLLLPVLAVGLAPLSTSFTEVAVGLAQVRSALVTGKCGDSRT